MRPGPGHLYYSFHPAAPPPVPPPQLLQSATDALTRLATVAGSAAGLEGPEFDAMIQQLTSSQAAFSRGMHGRAIPAWTPREAALAAAALTALQALAEERHERASSWWRCVHGALELSAELREGSMGGNVMLGMCEWFEAHGE
jgi:hypothetical protein